MKHMVLKTSIVPEKIKYTRIHRPKADEQDKAVWQYGRQMQFWQAKTQVQNHFLQSILGMATSLIKHFKVYFFINESILFSILLLNSQMNVSKYAEVYF